MMTLTDMDWGNAEWDVDPQAETLNKSLFGKRKAHKVKADLNLSVKDGSSFCANSDDDDDDENLSKKAKKKLKERKRKENKRNKNTVASSEKDGEKSNDKSEDKMKSMVENSSKKSEAKKPKAKTSDSKLVPNSKVKDKKMPAPRLVSKETEVKKKRKVSLDKQSEETGVEVKQSKKEGENSVLDNEDKPKKKRKRRKKKKPNSKKNKYKHLGLKSKSTVSQDISDSDGDSGDEEETTHYGQNDILTFDKSVTEKKAKKRKNSLSAETIAPAKKSKMDESEKVTSAAKTKKNKKKKHVEEATTAEGKNGDASDEDYAKLFEESNFDIGDISKMSHNLKVDNKKTNMRKEKNEKKLKNVNQTDSELELAEPSKSSPFFTSTHGTALQQKMVDKLASARFRFINEQLYTIKGGEAFRMFQQDDTLMAAYNTGFQGQVKQWSVNPLDVIIKQLKTKSAKLKVADFGCGEARLSASVPQNVHSFDLYALNKRVTVCDMAKTPLASGSMDVAVFCLSLMGTNLNDYILEANRILKEGGLLKIAEVVSRFTVPNHFINAVNSMGFRAVNTRELSAMFYLMDFKKVKNVEKSSKQTKSISLQPCVYKKR